MRILFVADGRSPIALNWMRYFIHSNDEVYLVSTFPCDLEPGLAGMETVPAAFSGAKRLSTELPAPELAQLASPTAPTAPTPPSPRHSSANAWGRGRAEGSGTTVSRLRSVLWGAGMVRARTAVRQWLGPLTLPGAARRLRKLVEQFQPDLVHAMRIPYEGMLAAMALEGLPGIPLLISVWGNDFTLHGQANPWMKRLTQRTLRRADALHTDCERDGRLARAWGFGSLGDSRDEKPRIVLPGNGGIDMQIFHPSEDPVPEQAMQNLRVINPRGVRAYVRNDTFFKAIPLVLEKLPETRFACLGMQGEGLAESWLRRLGVEGQVELLPKLPREQVAELFRECAVAVSPTTHDGTPNTLLEAMASGCFPVVGDLESLREWITQGENGLLVDPADPAALAQAVVTALRDLRLRQQARAVNARLIADRAEYRRCMSLAEVFYRQLIKKTE